MNEEDFGRIVRLTPLVSIDLILRNDLGQVLLGYRQNRPARNTWFVPGGRIRKDERLEDAWKRIASTELGITPDAPRLLGVYQHFYEDNGAGLPGVGTHYVVIGCEAQLPSGARLQADEQHRELRWWDVDALLASAEVHANTKAYFQLQADAPAWRLTPLPVHP
jgi:colanic acid biosynthesis protein WcaH